ncbi:MAG TPA: hypothetical protein VI585_04755 [Candidatus Binatia bacterium]
MKSQVKMILILHFLSKAAFLDLIRRTIPEGGSKHRVNRRSKSAAGCPNVFRSKRTRGLVLDYSSRLTLIGGVVGDLLR